ncbi:MAG: riboflavin biosynthesis protein RibF [Oscillospiraceae bacterium]|nr:riboflavin biosynthesis protein RibF [Oscillospiraceae bacterium]
MRRSIALGFFDGLHLGHQALLRRTVEQARTLGLSPALLTFDRSPREFVTGTPVPLLTTNEERRRAVETLFPGVEVITVPFDRDMMTMPWEAFVEMLADSYGALWLVAGHDFRFGHRNTGNAGLLREKAAALGVGCDIIPAVKLEGVTVSSTYIRSLLEKGDAETAARFLGRPFSVSGLVKHGKRLGSSRLDAPTVNVVPDPRQLVPAFGVYAAWVTVDGETRPAVTNVGVRPTVDTDGGVTVESHLLESVGELYGADCRVEFLKMLRSERRFGSLDGLREQIARDAEEARAYFANA